VIRRLTAIATWVLLLHLNLIASDLVCAQHHETSNAAVEVMTQHHAPAGVTHASGVTDAEKDGCQVPARSDCCHAMASCAVSLGLGASQNDVAPPTIRCARAPGSVDAPISFAFAPDPPPPKA
jgi:hypothetical protein